MRSPVRSLAQSKTVSSFDVSDGELLWRHDLNWIQGYEWAREKLRIQQSILGDLLAKIGEDNPEAVGRTADVEGEFNTTTFRNFWQAKQEQTFQRTAPILRSGSGATRGGGSKVALICGEVNTAFSSALEKLGGAATTEAIDDLRAELDRQRLALERDGLAIADRVRESYGRARKSWTLVESVDNNWGAVSGKA